MDHAPSFAKALTLLLRRDGYTVDTAGTGNLALAHLQECRYDVVVCDLHMPALDGPTFHDILRSQFPYLLQRVIFLTADTLSADSMTFLTQSGQPWLLKPCPIAAIRSAIEQVLRRGIGDSCRNACA